MRQKKGEKKTFNMETQRSQFALKDEAKWNCVVFFVVEHLKGAKVGEKNQLILKTLTRATY